MPVKSPPNTAKSVACLCAGGVVTALLADHVWRILFSVFFGAHLAEGMREIGAEEMGALIADTLCWPVGLALWFSSSYLLYQLVSRR